MKKTAITLSIERKEKKVINFRKEYEAYLELGNLDEMSRINAIIFELENEIQEDKSLFTTEREQIEEALKEGMAIVAEKHNEAWPNEYAEEYYLNTYGNGE